MEYKLEYAKILDWYTNIENGMSLSLDQFAVFVAMEKEIVNGNAISGGAADKFDSYIQNIHLGQLVPAIIEMQKELAMLISDYISGLERMDLSVDAVIDSSYLLNLENEIQNQKGRVVDVLDEIKTCTQNISYIIDLSPRSKENMECAYDSLKKQVKRTRDEYEQYEEEKTQTVQNYIEIMNVVESAVKNELAANVDPFIYSIDKHPLNVLLEVHNKKETYFPYSHVFDEERYKENIDTLQEVKVIRGYDKIGDKKEGKGKATVVSAGSLAYTIIKATGSEFALAADVFLAGFDYLYYSKIDQVAEKWKKDPVSVNVTVLPDALPGEKIQVAYGKIQDIDSIADFIKDVLHLKINVGSVYSLVSSVKDLVGMEESDATIIEHIEESIRYNYCIAELCSE